jgi:tRNA 2-selenouridine synthase
MMNKPLTNPAIVSAQGAIDALHGFDTIIDVRTPAEFEEDHLPGAINLPVLDNAQRVRVGTQYKGDAFTAKKIGAALMSRNIADHLESVLVDKPKDWRPLVYCWRGGNRSGGLATVLAKIGWRVTLLEGGYKAYRSLVIDQLPNLVAQHAFRVVCGPTGSGKTRLLKALAAQGRQVLDLEDLACHRGSLLGAEPDRPQPSQKAFESLIFEALGHFKAGEPVFVESESKKVGNLHVPDELMQRMRASDCIQIDMPIDQRVRLLCEEYAHFLKDPAPLQLQFDKLVELAGHQTVDRWRELVATQDWRALVEDLLIHHYDPAYQRSIKRNFQKVAQAHRLAMGSASQVDYEAAAASLSA